MDAMSMYKPKEISCLVDGLEHFLHIFRRILPTDEFIFFSVETTKTTNQQYKSHSFHSHLQFTRGYQWMMQTCINHNWLVVWNIFYFPIYWEQSSQLTFIFFGGVFPQPPTRQVTNKLPHWLHHAPPGVGRCIPRSRTSAVLRLRGVSCSSLKPQ